MEQTFATKKTSKSNDFSDSEKASGFSIPLSLSGAASSGADDPRNRNLESDLKSRITSNLGGWRGADSGIISSLENKSGIDLSDVSIYHNSPKPSKIGALAYAKGSNVFIGPGQDNLLGHELTHVVQQKQGLVSGDSSIGGQPVNTSPALERAADNMAVSSAPETGYSGDGVIQGVFISPSGKKESADAIKHIEEVLNGSINSIAETVNTGKGFNEFSQQEKKKIAKYIPKARKNIHKLLQKKQKSKTEYDTSSAITECMDEFYRGLGFTNKSSNGAFTLALTSGNKVATAGIAPKEKMKAKDTREGLDQSMSGFKLPETAYAGVENIGEYSVNDKMEELAEGRMGNSATLASELAVSEEEKAKRAASVQQFNNGAEAARKGAASIKENDDNISYEGLMGLFSNINKQVRGDSKGSGELRANKVSAGDMTGVGSSALPEATYVTFSHIAEQIKQIKRIPDKNLQKSQAIYLAAYAYQMTISEHMFSDGNGRTCRLFSDAILQSFGLPPSTPVQELSKAGKTMGQDFDFDTGAGYFLAGVQKSDQTAKEKRAAQQMGEKTSNQSMGYRSDQMGQLAASNADYDPTSSDPEQINLGLRRMYEKIKHPDPDEDPEVTSARKRYFAQQRAAQLNEEYKAANRKPSESKQAEPKKKKSWWQFWK